MADNTTFQTTVATPPSGLVVAAREATFGGDTAVAQVVTLTAVTGSEGSYTVREVFYADDAAFTPATGGVLATGMLFDDTGPDSVDEGDIGIGRMSARREAYIQIRDAAGNERGLNVDASGNITVNVTGTVTVGSHAVTNAGTFAVQAAQSGTWTVDLGATDNAVLDNIDADLTTIIGHVDGVEGLLTTIDGDTGNIVTAVQLLDDIVLAEDAAHQTGDKGVMALAVRQDAQADFGADGDYVPLSIDADGNLRTVVSGISVSGATEYAVDDALGATPTGTLAVAIRDDALSALTPVEGDAIGLRVNANGALWVEMANSVADQDADSGNPVKVGGKYNATLPTYTDGDRGDLQIGSRGALKIQIAGQNSNNQNYFQNSAQADGINNNANMYGFNTFGLLFNGTTWDRVRGDATDGQLVNLGSNNDVTVTGTVDLGATDNAVLDDIAAKLATIDADTSTLAAAVSTEYQVDIVGALPAGTNAIGKLAANSGVDIGDVDVTSIAAGTNTIGNVGLIPRASGGMTIFRSIDIDESEEEIKSSAGQIFSISAFNRTAAPLYLKFYDATAANTTVGTTTPVLTFVVPANADSDGAGFVWNNEIGFAFATAISVACTTGVADNDTGAPGANDCVVNVGYA